MDICKKLLIFSYLLFLFNNVWGQELIAGQVIDEQSQPMAFVNVVLLNRTDSTFIQGTVTKNDGTFSIQTERNSGLLRVSSVGYITRYIDVLPGNVGDIQMHPYAQMLGEVTVKGKQNPLSVQDGAFTLNVSKTFLKDQPDIFSVMGFLPFVESSEGKISVFGVGSTLYLINGREVYSMAEIEALRPDMIKTVHLDTHPSAQYNSKYGAVISITTVTRLKDFVNSQLSHKSVFSRKYSDTEGINLNIKSGQWAHFLSYQFKDLRKKEWAENSYMLYDEQNYALTSNNYSENHSNDHQCRHELLYSAGLTIDGHNSLNLQYMMEAGQDRDHANTIEQTVVGNTITNRTTGQNNRETSQLHNIDLLYKHNSSFGTFSIDGSYTFSTDNHKYLVTTNDNSLNRINGNNRYYVYSGQADYSRQIFGDIRFQVGVKYTHTHNVGLSDSSNPTTAAIYFHNDTQLDDALAAGYLTLSRQVGKAYLLAGVRGEYYKSDYQLDEQSLYRDDKFTLYPSVQVNYTVSPEFIVSLGYNNKSQRPTFTELSPVVRYINAMLYEQGNPGLRMTSTHNLYASFIIRQRLIVQFSYKHDRDFVMYAFLTNPQVPGNLISSPVNVNARYFILNASYSNKFGIYRFSYNANIHYDATAIPVMGSNERHFRPRYLLSTVNQFDVAKQTMAFCDFGIASSYWSLGNSIRPQYKLRIGLYKTFFADKRLTVTLSANDLLRRSEPDSSTAYNNVWSSQQMHLDTRNVSLTVKYNINKFKSVYKKNTNNDEEINRIR